MGFFGKLRFFRKRQHPKAELSANLLDKINRCATLAEQSAGNPFLLELNAREMQGLTAEVRGLEHEWSQYVGSRQYRGFETDVAKQSRAIHEANQKLLTLLTHLQGPRRK